MFKGLGILAALGPVAVWPAAALAQAQPAAPPTAESGAKPPAKAAAKPAVKAACQAGQPATPASGKSTGVEAVTVTATHRRSGLQLTGAATASPPI